MQGKIFAESKNLYQDQAKILFNYYRKAAEKIVKEEVGLEKSIELAKSEIELAKKNKIKGILIAAVFMAFGIALTILGGLNSAPVSYGYAPVLHGYEYELIAPDHDPAPYDYEPTVYYYVLVPLGYGLTTLGIVLVILGLMLIITGAIWGVVVFMKTKKSKTDNETKIQGFEEAHREIRRDYSVKKMGTVYIPIATKVPFEGKSFIVDHTGQTRDSDFKMSVAHKPEELLESLTSLEESIKNIPLVEQAHSPEEIDTSDYSTSIQQIKLYDYMGNIDRQVRNIRYLLNDSDTVSLSLPVIAPESETVNFIKEYSTSDTEGRPVVNVFNVDNFKEKLDTFYLLNDMKKSFEKTTNENQIAYFKKLIGRLAESVQILSKTKLSSSSKIVDYANNILSAVLKTSFNQYSPVLEAEEIERIRSASFDYQDSVEDYTPFMLKSSSRVKYDLFSTAWIAEDMSRTSMPFGMHQIQEEVLAPVIQNLMAENRVERLKIYNGIKDQKIDYLNQWHRDTEDFYGRNRAEAADIINLMREALGDYMRSGNTYKSFNNTLTSMLKSRSLNDAKIEQQGGEAEIIAAFEMQAGQFRQKQEEFTDYMDRLKENIDEKAKQFAHIPYYEATLRDKEYQDMALSAAQRQEIEPRRQKLLAVNPYVAKYAKLPPQPSVEQKMYDDFEIDLLKEAARTEAEGIGEGVPQEEKVATNLAETVVENSEDGTLATEAEEKLDEDKASGGINGAEPSGSNEEEAFFRADLGEESDTPDKPDFMANLNDEEDK